MVLFAKFSGLVCLGPTGLSGVLDFWLSLFFLELCFLIVYVTLFSASSLTTLLTVFGLFCFSSFTCFLILDVSHVLLKNSFFISIIGHLTCYYQRLSFVLFFKHFYGTLLWINHIHYGRNLTVFAIKVVTTNTAF